MYVKPNVVRAGGIQDSVVLMLILADDVCNVNVSADVDVDRFHFGRQW
jgi:hypothetical protein